MLELVALLFLVQLLLQNFIFQLFLQLDTHCLLLGELLRLVDCLALLREGVLGAPGQIFLFLQLSLGSLLSLFLVALCGLSLGKRLLLEPLLQHSDVVSQHPASLVSKIQVDLEGYCCAPPLFVH